MLHNMFNLFTPLRPWVEQDIFIVVTQFLFDVFLNLHFYSFQVFLERIYDYGAYVVRLICGRILHFFLLILTIVYYTFAMK